MTTRFGSVLRATAVVAMFPLALLPAATAADAAQPSTLLTREIDGLTYHFSADDEPIAREIAKRLAEIAKAAEPPVLTTEESADTTPAPLGVGDLRANRADYLRDIAALIGLEQPTELQEECYDGFLENFEATEKMFEVVRNSMRTAVGFHAVTIYRKSDLIRRLKAGEKIAGMTLDEDGESGSFNFGTEVQGQNPELKELFKNRDARRLDLGYTVSTKDGVADLSGYVSLKRNRIQKLAAKSESKPARDGESKPLTGIGNLPLIFNDEGETRSVEDIAAELAKFVVQFRELPGKFSAVRQDASTLALLILHETAEIGIMDRYLGSKDRRWLCDGMANYVAWKVARDRAGEEAARRVYDLDEQLTRWASSREKINLRRWAAAEHQSEEQKKAPLNKAHYPFATRAIFLMVERHGEDILPRLFQEIGRTPRKKANMRTVEKAYRKLTREKLSDLLAAAMAPVPTPAAAVGEPVSLR